MNEEPNLNENISNEPLKDNVDHSHRDSLSTDQSLRGVHKYLDSLVNRLESDATTSLKYRATDVYHNYNNLNGNNTSTGLDVFTKILGAPSNNETLNNIASEPNYIKRFLANSLDAPTSTSILRRRLTNNGIDTSNPAVVSELMQGMFSIGTGNQMYSNGYSLGGFKSRLVSPANMSPAPAVAGQLAQAMEQSLTHRSTKEILDGISGFQSRPDVGFYGFLFSGAGLPSSGSEVTSDVQAIFFQFQNSDLMNVMMREGVSFNLLTQRLDEQAFAQKDAQRVSILAGNELILNSTESFSPDTNLGKGKRAEGINYHHSFHPKIGHVKLSGIKPSYSSLNLIPNTGADSVEYRVGFIGTQNITAATSRHSTIESMLMVNANSSNATESALFTEIESYTQTLLDTKFITEFNNQNKELNNLTGDDYAQKGKEIYKSITEHLQTELGDEKNRFLKVNSEIITSYTNLLKKLDTETNRNLVAVLSFSEINRLGDSPEAKALKESITNLIKTNQIQVVVGADKYQQAMNKIQGLNELDINSATQADIGLLKELSNAGALNLAVTTHHHDKSIAVFDRNTKQLKALAIGSANPTMTSLGLLDSGGNVEVSAVIDSIGKTDNDVESYLAGMSGSKSELFRHYNALTSGAISNLTKGTNVIKKAFTKAYKVEQPALLRSVELERIQKIKQLHFALNNFTQTGSEYSQKTGAIQASFRYEPQLRNSYNYSAGGINKDDPIGLRIKITAPGKHGHTLSFDVTYSEEGNIIIADLNKIINGSIFVNKSSTAITLFDKAVNSPLITKRTLGGGEISSQSKLNPSETLLAFTETIQRAFIYQQEFGLVDLSFRAAVQQSKSIVLKDIKQLFADAFADALPNTFNLHRDSDGKSSQYNLKTILNSLAKRTVDAKSIESNAKIISAVSRRIANHIYGDSVISRNADHRQLLISNALEKAIPTSTNLSIADINTLDNVVAEKFLDTLLSGQEEFNDIKKQLINVNESARAAYKSATLTQARTILDELTGSFLSVHEETYAYFQGQERMSIFGETQNFNAVYGDSQIASQYRAGILNPLPVGHTTRVATAGSLYRSLSSTARGETLMLPGFGGLNQLTVTDSDLSSGAAVGQDFESMTKTSPGLMSLTLEESKKHLQELLTLTDDSLNEDLESPLLDQAFSTHTRLIYTPFDKLEQLTQRLKNVVGFRPALEFSQDFALSIINALGGDENLKAYYNIHTDAEGKKNLNEWGEYLDKYDPNDPSDGKSILSGSLRNVLPATQYEKLIETRKAIAKERYGDDYQNRLHEVTFNDLQEYYRKALLKQGNVQHGFIGGSKYRRFALNLGASMFGDFTYLNSGYTYQQDSEEQAQIYGKQHNLRIKFNPDKVENVLSTIDKITSVFSTPVIATTQSINYEGITVQAGVYKVITDKNGVTTDLIKVGSYTDKGLVHLHGEMRDGVVQKADRINAIKYTDYGPRPEPILIKLPAFPKRTEGGITYIAPTPHLVDTARTTNIIELNTYTMFRPGTASRFGGGGLAKGPVVYKTADLFQQVEEQLEAQFTPGSIKQDKLYGLGSLGTFKGVNYEAGLYLLSQQDSRDSIKGVSDRQLLEGLSLLFIGDKQIKEGLVKHFTDTNNYTAALAVKSMDGGKDASKGRFSFDSTAKNALPAGGATKDAMSALALTATGILSLGGEKAIKNLDVSVVKDLLITALQGDKKAIEQLKTRFTKLIDLVETRSISEATNVDSKIIKTLIINEQDSINRGAGILAHMLDLSTQLFSSSTKPIASLFDVPLSGKNVEDLYRGKDNQGNKVESIEGYDRRTYIDYAHQMLLTSGFQPKNINTGDKDTDENNIKENLYMMNLVHRRLNRAKVIETVIDNQISQSLVASGMRDTVKQEYQFYLGMTNTKLNEYRSLVGEEGKTIQEAYLVAVAALDGGDLNTMTRQQTLGIKLAASLVDSNIKADSHHFEGAGGLLRYQDLSLRTIAALYSSDVNYKVPVANNNVNVLTASVLNVSTAQNVQQIEYSRQLMSKLLNSNNVLLTEGQSDAYTAGLLEMETILRSEIQSLKGRDSDYKKALKTSLKSITDSQRIILPNLEYNTDGDGGYFVQFKSISNESPAQGILLGTDFLSRIAQSFGDFETEIMSTQVALVSALHEAQPVLAKLMDLEDKSNLSNFRLTESEVNSLARLQNSLRDSTKTLMAIPVTDIARQYAGDHESTKGAVGIAVNSFMLNPDEVVLGDRYLRIAGTQNQNGQVNKNSKLGVFVNTLVSKLSQSHNSKILDIEGYTKIQGVYQKELLTVLKSFSVLEGLSNQNDPRYKWAENRSERLKNLTKDLDTTDSNKISKLRSILTTGYGLAVDMTTKSDSNYKASSSRSEGLSTVEKQLLLKAAIYTDILGATSIDTLSEDRAINEDILARVIEDYIQQDILKNQTEYDDVINGLESNPDLYKSKESDFTLEKLGYMAAGFMVARTGQPGGSSAQDSDTNQFVPLDKYLFEARRQALNPGSNFKLDQSRIDTGFIVPSNSRLLSGLGDYDGDSYRITTKQVDVKSFASNVEDVIYKNPNRKAIINLRENIEKYNELALKLGLTKLSDYTQQDLLNILNDNKQIGKRLRNVSRTIYTNHESLDTQNTDAPSLVKKTSLGNLIDMINLAPTKSIQVLKDYEYVKNAFNHLTDELLSENDKEKGAVKKAKLIKKRLFDESLDLTQKVGDLNITYGDIKKLFMELDETKNVNNLSEKDFELSQYKKVIGQLSDLSNADKSTSKLRFDLITQLFLPSDTLSKYNLSADFLNLIKKGGDFANPLIHLITDADDYQELINMGLIYKNKDDDYFINTNKKTKIKAIYETRDLDVNKDRLDKLNNTTSLLLRSYLSHLEQIRKNKGDLSLPEVLKSLSEVTQYLGRDTQNNYLFNDFDESIFVGQEETPKNLSIKLLINSKQLNEITSLIESSSKNIKLSEAGSSLLNTISKSEVIIKNHTFLDYSNDPNTKNFTVTKNIPIDVVREFKISDLLHTLKTIKGQIGSIQTVEDVSTSLNLLKGVKLLSSHILDPQNNDLIALHFQSSSVINNLFLDITSDLVSKTADLVGVNDSIQLSDNVQTQFESIYDQTLFSDLNRYKKYIENKLPELVPTSEEDDYLENYSDLGIGLLSQDENSFRRREARKMLEVERFIKSYTNVPEFVFSNIGDEAKLSTGEMFSFISQKYDLSNVADSAEYNNYYIGNALLLKAIQTESGINNSVTFDSGLKNKFKTAFNSTNIQDFLSSNLTTLLDNDKDLLNIAYQKLGLTTTSTVSDLMNLVTTSSDSKSHLDLITNRLFHEMEAEPAQTINDSILNVMADNANLNQSLDITSKKVVGRLNTNLLSPIEFDASISVIGEGGTNLIGRAYNTLIPLLDSLIIEQAFMYSTVSSNLSDALNSGDYGNLAIALGVSTNDSDRQTAVEQRIKFRERFAGVTSILSNFQQIVRDALKAKEGDNILDKFHQVFGYQEDLTSLIDVLQKVPDGNNTPRDIERNNKNAVTQFLANQMGPSIGNKGFLQGEDGTGSNYAYSPYANDSKFGLLTTGFGALTLLGEYARIEDEGFYQHFIEEGNTLLGNKTKEQFEAWVATTEYDSTDQNHLAKKFVGLQIIDMMQRTQATFSVSSLGEAKVNSIVDRLSNLVKKVGGRVDNAELMGVLFNDGIDTITDEINNLLGIESSLDNDKQLMESIDKKQKMEKMVVDFQEQSDVYRSYKEYIDTLQADDDKGRKAAKANLVSELILRNIQNRDKEYNTLNTNTLEYLRKAAFDMSIFNSSNEIGQLPSDQQLQLASLFGYNHRLRALRSGKISDVGTALEASQFKLNSIIQVLHKQGVDLNDLGVDSDQVDMILNYDDGNKSNVKPENLTKFNIAGLVSGLTKLTSLDDEASKELLKFMISSHVVGEDKRASGLSLLAQDSASLAVYEKLIDHQQKAKYEGNNTLAEALTSRLNDFFTNYNDNNSIYDADLVQGIDNYDLDGKLAESATQRVQNIINEETARVDNQIYREQKATLNRMKSGSMIGILAAPLLFALGASGEVKLDDRVGMFAFDAMQALAEVSAQPKSVTGQYTTSDMNAATMGFRNARIRQAIREEGLALGAVQGVSQELLYRGVGGIVDLGVRSTIGRIAQKNPTLGTVGGTAFSEILGGILTQAVSKAIIRRTKPKQEDEGFLEETLKHLQNISEQVWQATEDALLNAIQNKDVEIGDGELAGQLDFEASAILSSVELDQITGLAEITVADVDEKLIGGGFEEGLYNSNITVRDYQNA